MVNLSGCITREESRHEWHEFPRSRFHRRDAENAKKSVRQKTAEQEEAEGTETGFLKDAQDVKYPAVLMKWVLKGRLDLDQYFFSNSRDKVGHRTWKEVLPVRVRAGKFV